jgi:hypothetical protein
LSTRVPIEDRWRSVSTGNKNDQYLAKTKCET